MLRYRPFRNSDSPHLAELFRLSPKNNSAGQITSTVLEHLVFSKPYFQAQGLIVAESTDGHIVGFAHAGFGPNDDLTEISYDMGVICLLLVHPAADFAAIAPNLLQRAEFYLRESGATVLYGGGVYPLNPFYVGIYGGGELPGLLRSDGALTQLFRASGYRESQRSDIFRCPLAEFRAPVDRRQLVARRQSRVARRDASVTGNWWTACVRGAFDCARYELISNIDGLSLGHVSIQDANSVIPPCDERVVTVLELEIGPDRRGQGLGTFLLSETLKDLKLSFDVVQLQTMEDNATARRFYKKLGFVEMDQGIVFRKE